MATYRTHDGDMLDAICWQHYGSTAGIVEQVLMANPNLAARGSVYPAGITITLPVISPKAAAGPVRLWD